MHLNKAMSYVYKLWKKTSIYSMQQKFINSIKGNGNENNTLTV